MVLPIFPYLWAEHNTCLGGGGKVGSYTFVQMKEQLLFSHRGSSTFHSWRKVGKVMVLEKRKAGTLEFSEHNTEVRWGYGIEKRKLKAERKSREMFRTTQTGQLRGTHTARNAEEEGKVRCESHVSPSFGSKWMPQPFSPFSLSLCCVDTQRSEFSGFF